MTNAFCFQTLCYSEKPQALTSSLFSTVDGAAEKAFITSEGEWRFMSHGGDPSREEGHLLRDGGILILHGILQIRNFKAISLSDSSKLSISFER